MDKTYEAEVYIIAIVSVKMVSMLFSSFYCILCIPLADDRKRCDGRRLVVNISPNNVSLVIRDTSKARQKRAYRKLHGRDLSARGPITADVGVDRDPTFLG